MAGGAAADKLVEVPGMGNVSFPGTMSDEDVNYAIHSQLQSQEAQTAKARAAQPTQFERARADASNTPWKDTLKGFGEELLAAPTLIGQGIHAIPKVGPALIPSEGLTAEQKMSTQRTAGEKFGGNLASVAEMAIPVGPAAEAVKGSRFVRPAAQFLSENVIPEIKALPYVGRGIEAAEKAPNFVKAAIRGGTTGATLGGIEQAIRTRDPYETAKGVVYGGVGGAGLGMAAHGINRLANRIPAVGEAPFELTAPEEGRETAVQQTLGFPKVEEGAPTSAGEQGQSGRMPSVREPGRVGPPLQRLGELIEQAAGTKPLEPAISLRNQMPQSVGAAAEGFPAVGDVPPKNMGGPVTFRREPIAKTIPGLEEGPLRAQAPEGLPAVATEEPARQMGAPPLQPAVPLREQLKPTGMEPASKQLTLEQKYPDREVRQLVHANGEDIVQAAGNDRETLKAIHDLKNPDVRQALINSGEDMGQVSIGNRKAMGESQLSRQDAFKRLLAKGLTPRQIVDLAKQEMSEGTKGKPGLMRATGEPPAREKTGD